MHLVGQCLRRGGLGCGVLLPLDRLELAFAALDVVLQNVVSVEALGALGTFVGPN